MATSQTTIDTIKNWYQNDLGRAADQSGLDFWANAANSGKDLNALKTDFLAGAQKNGESIKPQSQGLIDSPYAYTDYGGQKVRTDDDYMQQISRNAQSQGMSTQDYDKMVNPETYGARWGVPAKTAAKPASTISAPSTGTDATLLNPDGLARRTVDPGTETVAGQMDSLLKANGSFLQGARARGERVAAGRGLINSTMAGSAGEDAAINAALGIAAPDAAIFGKAADYNTALTNQASMYNADAMNSFAAKRIDFSNQRQLAQLQADTSRYQAELQDKTSRYNTDAQYKRQVDANRDQMVNNILMQSPDNMSPDRKAAALEQLGMGTAARRAANGSVIPGTGLAGAVYVIDSVAADLAA